MEKGQGLLFPRGGGRVSQTQDDHEVDGRDDDDEPEHGQDLDQAPWLAVRSHPLWALAGQASEWDEGAVAAAADGAGSPGGQPTSRCSTVTTSATIAAATVTPMPNSCFMRLRDRDAGRAHVAGA